MLYSMTGYGSSKQGFGSQTVSIEIKSLNSKSLDLRTKMPNAYLSYELELRKVIQNELVRGKVDVVISVESSDIGDYRINTPILEQYIYQLLGVAGQHGLERGDVLYTASRFPNVIVSNESSIGDTHWEEVLQTLQTAIAQFKSFRLEEGNVIYNELTQRVKTILELLTAVEQYEQERLDKVRQRIRQQLEQLAITIDENRFEQELIYYLEKYDFSEEKTRLLQHCTYFQEEMQAPAISKGNKLNFISQEMGREINTLGSKANSADIQRLVVQMKDELEKIKEQLANVL